MNKELYNTLLDAGEVIACVERADSEINKMEGKIGANNSVVFDAEFKISSKPKGYTALLYMGIFEIMACIFIIPISLIVIAAALATAEFGLVWKIIAVSVMGGACIGFPFLTICTFVTRSNSLKRHRNIRRQEYEVIRAEYDEKNNEIQEKIEKIKEEYAKYLEDNRHKVAPIPADYHTTDAIGFMLKAVENLRADTLKEAINLYDTELKHRQAMEAAELARIQKEEMMYAMRMMNANMESLNEKQAETNRNLRNVQFWQTLDYFTKN